MKQIETRIVCDLCEGPRCAAEIRCDKHRLDLCTRHMRAHFDPKKCRLVPVERKQTQTEKAWNGLDAMLGKPQDRKPPD